ncbi:MAG: ATP-binding protein, partial [Syntrophobacteraceae bacterium]
MPILRLPASMESFEPFRSFVLQHLKGDSQLEDLTNRVDLALEEVLVNAIHYAYPENEGEIEIECRADGEGRFYIALRDWGGAFNPVEQAAPDLTSDIDHRQVGGLGIFLVKQMASRLAYE